MVASYLDDLAPVLSQVVEPAAVEVDQAGSFPRAAVDALGRAGLLGLTSAHDVTVPAAAMVGEDGKGDQIMLGIVLGWFAAMSAAMAVGLMEAAVQRAVAHVTATRLEHLDSRLADLPTIAPTWPACTSPPTRPTPCWTTPSPPCRPAARTPPCGCWRSRRPPRRPPPPSPTWPCASAAVPPSARRPAWSGSFATRAATVMAPTTGALYDFVGRAICGLDLFA